jgi:signal transduction histidine kinase
MEKQLTLFDGEADYFEQKEELDADSAVFRVHASLIYKLGESLIADEITALSELIKNSYDADAGICVVNIDSNYQENINGCNCAGLIEISDNGCGMDLNTIINGWLTISNSPKKKMKKENRTTDKYHRYPLGDKGLGRLAVQKLGRYMQLTTKKEKSKIEYTVTIPWGDFLKNTTIDKIPVKIIKREVYDNKSYTKIVVKDLVDSRLWCKDEQVDVLSNSISKIVSPFRSKENTFRVVAKINGELIPTDTKAFDELLRTARAKYLIKYSNGKAVIFEKYKSSFFYTRETLGKVLLQKLSFTETMLDDFVKINGKKIPKARRINEEGFILEEVDECLFPDIVLEQGDEGNVKEYNNPGDFECEIYEYMLEPKYIDLIYQNMNFTNIIDRDEYNDFVRRYQGIKVVRDGFLVQGFGEGNGGDWLGLSSRSKTTGKYMDLRNESVIGCVYLTGVHNSSLKETTNREGFVADGYYRNFKRILDEVISRLNKNRSKLNTLMREYINISEKHSSEAIDGEKGIATSIENIQEKVQVTTELIFHNENRMEAARKKLNQITRIVKEAPFIPEESLDYLKSLDSDLNAISYEFKELDRERSVICNEIETIQLEYEKINNRMRDVFELAGLGISVETFTHEFDTAIHNIKEKNHNIIINKECENIESLIQHINYVTYALDALRKQMSYFNPGLKYVRAERQTFNIREFLQQHRDFYCERCKRNNISFRLEIASDFVVRINRGMLNQVFDNLFNNSEYWLDFSQKYGYIDHKEYFIQIKDRGYILIWDNGLGISRDIEDRLFEPFESKKENGRGLGLYIVASNLKYNSASIKLLQERNSKGNLYKFEVNLLEIVQ